MGIALGRRLLRRRRRRAARRRRPTRRSRIGRRRAAESYLDADEILEAAHRHGRRGDPPGLRLPERERRLRRRAARRPGIALRRSDAGADPGLRPQAHRARAGGEGRACRCCRARGCLTTIAQARRAAEAHRLSGDAQEHRRRRRHRHAPLRRQRASSPQAFDAVHAPGREQLRRRAASTWRSSSSPPATSRCRSSATGGGGCWRSASATARCSGATRR